jgi:hypothetical protein
MKLIDVTRATTVCMSVSCTKEKRARSSGEKSFVRSKAAFQAPDATLGQLPHPVHGLVLHVPDQAQTSAGA